MYNALVPYVLALQTIEIINQRSINQLHYNDQRKFATIIRLYIIYII